MSITTTPPVSNTSATAKGPRLFSGDGGMPSFEDVLDVINPLQQIPIVSNVYRAATGDSISIASRVAGGALIGGPLGALGGLVSGLVEAAMGGDVVSKMASALKSGEPMQVVDEQVARTPFQTAPGSADATAGQSDALLGVLGNAKEKVVSDAATNVALHTQLKTDTFGS